MPSILCRLNQTNDSHNISSSLLKERDEDNFKRYIIPTLLLKQHIGFRKMLITNNFHAEKLNYSRQIPCATSLLAVFLDDSGLHIVKQFCAVCPYFVEFNGVFNYFSLKHFLFMGGSCITFLLSSYSITLYCLLFKIFTQWCKLHLLFLFVPRLCN